MMSATSSAMLPASAVLTLPSGRSVAGRQLAFVKNFARHFVGARAAREAGVSDSTAKVQAHRWLHDPAVQEALEYEVHERFEAAQVSVVRVLRSAYDVMTATVQDFFDEQGVPIPIHLIPRHKAAAIKEIECERVETTAADGSVIVTHRAKLKLKDDARAREHLGKFLGMWSGEEKDGGLLPVEFIIEEIAPNEDRALGTEGR